MLPLLLIGWSLPRIPIATAVLVCSVACIASQFKKLSRSLKKLTNTAYYNLYVSTATLCRCRHVDHRLTSIAP